MLCHDSSLLRRLYAKITWPVSVRTFIDPTNFPSCDHWIVRHQTGLGVAMEQVVSRKTKGRIEAVSTH
jgi:hypothetical protein